MAEVPCIASGRFGVDELRRMMVQSAYSQERMEGLVLRAESGGWLVDRAKLVRPDFVQRDQAHWSRRGFQVNRIDWGERARLG